MFVCSVNVVIRAVQSLVVFVSVAKGPYSGVVKLQTMRCLFEAYEHVLSLLERVFTPMFCHSDEVRRHAASTHLHVTKHTHLPL